MKVIRRIFLFVLFSVAALTVSGKPFAPEVGINVIKAVGGKLGLGNFGNYGLESPIGYSQGAHGFGSYIGYGGNYGGYGSYGNERPIGYSHGAHGFGSYGGYGGNYGGYGNYGNERPIGYSHGAHGFGSYGGYGNYDGNGNFGYGRINNGYGADNVKTIKVVHINGK